MLPQDGFVDTVTHIDQDSGALSVMVKPYAALPSMHCCVALIVGRTGARLARTRRGAVAWAAYPRWWWRSSSSRRTTSSSTR
jgi:hypothetical protein